MEVPVDIVPVYAMSEGQSKFPTGSGTFYTTLLPFLTSMVGLSFQTRVGTASSVRGAPFGGVGPVVVGVSLVCPCLSFCSIIQECAWLVKFNQRHLSRFIGMFWVCAGQ